MIDLNEKVTQSEFGSLVGISQPAVSQFVSSGVLSAEMTVGQMLIAYCAHLRETAAGRLASGDLDLAEQRARVAKEQADKLAMQNAITRKELAPVFLIEEVLAKAGARVAGIMDAIVPACRRLDPGLPAQVLEQISREVAKARNVAAKVSLEDLMEEEGDDAGQAAEEVIEE